jgi:hypothetical protein
MAGVDEAEKGPPPRHEIVSFLSLRPGKRRENETPNAGGFEKRYGGVLKEPGMVAVFVPGLFGAMISRSHRRIIIPRSRREEAGPS